ncbi:beta-ketoacyl synthase chain length factor [Dyella mobilis]|uniref:Beta-ketoacyl synthase chain length factor n=1 Tax=Dyella mobilis TaxID=1849582 RepID=A0ABS2KAK0_9GAMM|nr:beta-ketoacyl synthase chain length factor [Dyella mobilis]MBM7128184.1 beta-ketoacyl synthase chain length factor [Dyella mobilis]GLR00002.1 hypothetical protein GCM10007863_44210 [Dyella mobilis]
MSELRVQVEGIGAWTPHATGWDAFKRVFAGDPPSELPARPAATALSPNERRRAPESVLVAIEVAAQAIAASQRAGGDLACVFASAYGDQATTDYMCRILARAPAELSPTRFHNSVHNAAAGYWTIATECRAPSTAMCAGLATFGASLLEAATQVCADHRAVLLVCSDTVGVGPLGELIGCHLAFGCAMVLAPCTDQGALSLRLTTVAQAPRHSLLAPTCMKWMSENPSAASLPLLATLAHGGGDCVLAASDQLGLLVQTEVTA